jgi:hemerythrin-like domain-containing protein/uncharacterized protein (DUF2249 family)
MTPSPLHPVRHREHDHHQGQPSSSPTAALRHEHEIILRTLAVAERLGGALTAGQPVDRDALAWVVDFFRTFADRCHHGKEEQHLFPALERHGIPREGGPIGIMLEEHEQGRRFLAAMASGNDRAVAEAIRGYAQLLRAHIDKENGVLFPMAEQVLSEAERRALVTEFEDLEQTAVGPGVHERLLAGLTRLEGPAPGSGGVLDVRQVAPRERHPKIFGAYQALGPGQAFVLVNDHDPKPLYYQFAAEQAGAFTWDYVEEGPAVWRVRIGKRA